MAPGKPLGRLLKGTRFAGLLAGSLLRSKQTIRDDSIPAEERGGRKEVEDKIRKKAVNLGTSECFRVSPSRDEGSRYLEHVPKYIQDTQQGLAHTLRVQGLRDVSRKKDAGVQGNAADDRDDKDPPKRHGISTRLGREPPPATDGIGCRTTADGTTE
jgi:hypothetical protein